MTFTETFETFARAKIFTESMVLVFVYDTSDETVSASLQTQPFTEISPSIGSNGFYRSQYFDEDGCGHLDDSSSRFRDNYAPLTEYNALPFTLIIPFYIATVVGVIRSGKAVTWFGSEKAKKRNRRLFYKFYCARITESCRRIYRSYYKCSKSRRLQIIVSTFSFIF